MRSFVHAEVGAYTVASAVTIVVALTPHGRTGSQIKLRATGIAWKLQAAQRYMALQYQGIDTSLLLRSLSPH